MLLLFITNKSFEYSNCSKQSKLLKLELEATEGIRGQSYKTFYTLGQFYKRTLKHVNNEMRQTFVHHNVRTLHPNIFIGLHFSF